MIKLMKKLTVQEINSTLCNSKVLQKRTLYAIFVQVTDAANGFAIDIRSLTDRQVRSTNPREKLFERELFWQ